VVVCTAGDGHMSVVLFLDAEDFVPVG
jgi:hypothetical protein